ncbi:MAG: hypothetical protein AWU57_1260 [Marinobacter sp. T13-3]|nr:MAG: hypothetical protein AWU57_1260 [Marinobacter sp. T13-3]
MNEGKINIAVLGKTGSGKSSFCNYIFGESVFNTGVGAPVTGWDQHFAFHTVSCDGFELRLFDSVGIEADNLPDWKRELDKFLDEKAPRNKVNPTDWIHSAIYVINAASARIEPSEIQIIKAIRNRNVPVQVVFSNADKASVNQIEGLREKVISSIRGVDVTDVCSVSVKKRSGETSEAFGRDEFLIKLIANMDKELKGPLIEALCHAMNLGHRDASKALIAAIDKADIGLFYLIRDAIKNDGDVDFDKMMDVDSDKILEGKVEDYDATIEAVELFSEAFSKHSEEITTTHDIARRIQSEVKKFMDDKNREIENYFEREIETLESGTGWEQAKALFSIGKVFLNMKKFLKERIENIMDSVISETNKQKAKFLKG